MTDSRFGGQASYSSWLDREGGSRIPFQQTPSRRWLALANGDPWLPTPAERDAKVQALASTLKQSHGQTVSY